MTVGIVCFVVVAAVGLASGAMVALARHPVRAVIWLMPALCSIAVLIGATGAWAMAALVLVVFAGGVLVPLAALAVMGGLDAVDLTQAVQTHRPLIVRLGIVVLAQFAMALLLAIFPAVERAAVDADAIGLSGLLVSTQFALLPLAGLVLVIALAGAVHLTLRQAAPVSHGGLVARIHRGRTVLSDEGQGQGG